MERDKDQSIVTFSRDQNGALTYEPFMANGKKFKFIKPGDPVGMAKWGKFNTLSIIVGSGVTFAELVSGLTAHQKLLGADKPFSEIRTEAIVWCDHMKRGIVDLSKNRHDPAFYLASLFIYRDGEHPFEWTEEAADEMIADWQAGHVSEQDLFFCAQSSTRLERDIVRITGPGGKERGQIIGRYYLDETKRRFLRVEMAENNLRHAIEFVMKTSPYTKNDIMGLDVLTFLRILKECEEQQQNEISRLEKQGNG